MTSVLLPSTHVNAANRLEVHEPVATIAELIEAKRCGTRRHRRHSNDLRWLILGAARVAAQGPGCFDSLGTGSKAGGSPPILASLDEGDCDDRADQQQGNQSVRVARNVSLDIHGVPSFLRVRRPTGGESLAQRVTNL
jgi:hypothetical protein